MKLFYGSGPCPFHMSATRRYHPEELQRRADLLMKNDKQVFIQVENEFHKLAAAEIPLAAAICASYHNQVCYNLPPDDGWDAETRSMEAAAMDFSGYLVEEADMDHTHD